MPTADDIILRLEALADRKNVEGMKRFAIGGKHTLGISIPVLRKMAKEVGRDHRTATALWDSGIHEARILASMVDDPALLTEEQMERWAADLDSWDVTDQVCMNLFEKVPLAWTKAIEWTGREGEFQKRAGFALMACLAWHDKKSPPSRFMPFFPAVEQAADDGRNFVKKAASWALRNMGKRTSASWNSR